MIVNIYLFVNLDNKELLPNGRLSILMIDVGQGDAILIKFPRGKTAIIDAGDATKYFDNGQRVIAPLMNYLGISKIDYGFVSHIDNDHSGGFYSLVKSKLIKKIYKPSLDSTLVKDKRFEKFLKENKVSITYYDRNLINIDGTVLYVLNNLKDKLQLRFDTNNSCGVLKIEYGNNKFLFDGDIELPAENYLIKKYQNFLNVDLLKIAHHGSKTGSSQNFLEAATPVYGLISVGINNKFKHPSPSVIKRLEEDSIKIFRTDKRGAVLMCSDGDSIYNVDWRDD